MPDEIDPKLRARYAWRRPSARARRHGSQKLRSPGLADRILAEARRAAEAGDHGRFLRSIALGQVESDERRTALLREVFEAAVSRGHVDLADVCVSCLRDAGFIDEAWILSHLAWGDPYVEIAAGHVQVAHVPAHRRGPPRALRERPHDPRGVRRDARTALDEIASQAKPDPR